MAKEKTKTEIGLGTISNLEIKERMRKTLEENPEIREKVKTNNPQNRFIADRGIESRLVATRKLYDKLGERGNVEIYIAGGIEQNTLEDNLYRSEIVKKRLHEVYDIPAESIIPTQSSVANTEGNMESFLTMLKSRHDLTNIEVHLVTDERHLPRATVMLYLEAYRKLHGKNLEIPEELIQQIIPILDKFKRFKDEDKFTAEEASKKLLEFLQTLGGNIRPLSKVTRC